MVYTFGEKSPLASALQIHRYTYLEKIKKCMTFLASMSPLVSSPQIGRNTCLTTVFSWTAHFRIFPYSKCKFNCDYTIVGNHLYQLFFSANCLWRNLKVALIKVKLAMARTQSSSQPRHSTDKQTLVGSPLNLLQLSVV